MSLAQKFGVQHLRTRDINSASRNHNVEEIVQFIRSNESFLGAFMTCPPVNEELGHHVSDAIVQNSHIRELLFFGHSSAILDLVAWIGSRSTLVNMTSLDSVVVHAHQDMSVLDFSALFPLLLTSTSLHSLRIEFAHHNGCSDDVLSGLLWYLDAASLREFDFRTCRLSEAAFTALCNGVALSTVRQFTLIQDLLPEFSPETAAESLAWMIVESSLEEVTIDGWFGGLSTWYESLISALKLTAPVQNMDFAFTKIGHDTTGLRINRKWKPLVIGANAPLALWPRILEKSHPSPETSHGFADILFYILRQKPDLVPDP